MQAAPYNGRAPHGYCKYHWDRHSFQPRQREQGGGPFPSDPRPILAPNLRAPWGPPPASPNALALMGTSPSRPSSLNYANDLHLHTLPSCQQPRLIPRLLCQLPFVPATAVSRCQVNLTQAPASKPPGFGRLAAPAAFVPRLRDASPSHFRGRSAGSTAQS